MWIEDTASRLYYKGLWLHLACNLQRSIQHNKLCKIWQACSFLLNEHHMTKICDNINRLRCKLVALERCNTLPNVVLSQKRKMFWHKMQLKMVQTSQVSCTTLEDAITVTHTMSYIAMHWYACSKLVHFQSVTSQLLYITGGDIYMEGAAIAVPFANIGQQRIIIAAPTLALVSSDNFYRPNVLNKLQYTVNAWKLTLHGCPQAWARGRSKCSMPMPPQNIVNCFCALVVI